MQFSSIFYWPSNQNSIFNFRRHLLLRINLWPGRCPRWPATTSQSYPCPPLMATPTPTWATRTGSTTPGRPPTLITSVRPRTSKGSRRGWCPPTPFQPKKRKKKAKSHSSKLSSPQSCDLIFWQIYFYLSCLSPNVSREKPIPNSALLWYFSTNKTNCFVRKTKKNWKNK